MENKLLRPHPKEDVGKKKGNFIGNYVIPHILGKNKKTIDVPLITFLGAARTVTGSKYLIRYKDKKILIDCGLFQGIKDDKIKNKKELPVSPKKIDAIILTHAHLDHSGYIPLMVKEGFKGPIYSTKATFELCKIILPDSGYLQEEDAKYMKKKKVSKEENPEPLYTEEDAIKSLKRFKTVRFGDKIRIDNNISFEINHAGHILGAGTISLYLDNKKIVFSGDLGRTDDDILYDPAKIKQADYILCESTYGDRTHKDTDQKEDLAEIINRTINRGGNLIVPAFAVGRTQLLLYYIHQLKKQKKIPSVPIFIDSPMSVKVTNLLDDFADEHKLSEDECLDMFEDAKFTPTVEQSKRIFECKIPSIIISASGMMTGGRILHHVAHYGADSKNTILLVGFQANGTRGRALQDGKKELRIHGQVVKINAEVTKLENMSAHADSNELMDWLNGFQNKPEKLFVIHGEEKSSITLSERVKKELDWETYVPDYLETQQL